MRAHRQRSPRSSVWHSWRIHANRDVSEQRICAGVARRRRALAAQIGTRVFWVQTGGYDTHAAQNTLNGTYAG